MKNSHYKIILLLFLFLPLAANAITDLATKHPKSEVSKTAFQKMMGLRAGTADAMMKELLRLKNNARISTLLSEAHISGGDTKLFCATASNAFGV